MSRSLRCRRVVRRQRDGHRVEPSNRAPLEHQSELRIACFLNEGRIFETGSHDELKAKATALPAVRGLQVGGVVA